MSADDPLTFSVKHGDTKLKISLDARWREKKLEQSVVIPFVKTFNKKHAGSSSTLAEAGLLGMCAGGATWVDATKTAAVLPPATSVVELFFGSKEELEPRQCRVCCGDVALKIEVDAKWLRQPFMNAVVTPFTLSYNKKLVPTPLRPEDFSAADVDGDQISVADAAKPTALVLPLGAKNIDLSFGAANDNSSGGASCSTSGLSDAERLKLFWGKESTPPSTWPAPRPHALISTRIAHPPQADAQVNSSADKLAAAPQIKWTNLRLGPADAAPMSAALHAAALVRCEGSYGTGLCNLITVNLECNDLRDEGIELLAPAFDGSKVMVSVKELYLMNNRIGDRGLEALIKTTLPRQLKILSLQDNSIGPDGMLALSSAISSGRFYVRHLNVLDNKCQYGSAMQDLKDIVQRKYIELKAPRLDSAAEAMRKT